MVRAIASDMTDIGLFNVVVGLFCEAYLLGALPPLGRFLFRQTLMA